MATLLEDLGSSLSTHMAAPNHLTPVPRDLTPSWPQAPGMHMVHRLLGGQNTHLQKLTITTHDQVTKT